MPSRDAEAPIFNIFIRNNNDISWFPMPFHDFHAFSWFPCFVLFPTFFLDFHTFPCSPAICYFYFWIAQKVLKIEHGDFSIRKQWFFFWETSHTSGCAINLSFHFLRFQTNRHFKNGKSNWLYIPKCARFP